MSWWRRCSTGCAERSISISEVSRSSRLEFASLTAPPDPQGVSRMKKPVKVAITGAAGQIAYSLIFRVADGSMLGPDQPVILQLLEVPVPEVLEKLKGTVMDLKDLLTANGGIFGPQGKALSEKASRDVRVLVVGNPANTNALIAASNAKKLDPKQIHAMVRLDHNRAVSQLAAKTGAHG